MPQVVSTEDGSITCLDEGTGELYHNRSGAYTEALKNYIEPCDLPSLLQRQSNLTVLDVCFGLGYNSFVLLDQLLLNAHIAPKAKGGFALKLVALDKDPEILKVTPEVLRDWRFNQLITQFGGQSLASACQRPGSYQFTLGELEKIKVSFELRCCDVRVDLPRLAREKAGSFDFIFHDGFSPKRMPELWTLDLFRLYAHLIKPTGKIITYSSASAVRGALQSLGLIVKRTAAVGGKSGGTIAGFEFRADAKFLHELTAKEIERLKTRSAVPYRDHNFSLTPREIVLNRNEEVRRSELPAYQRERR